MKEGKKEKRIFSSNHIDPNNGEEKNSELKKLYEFYHKLWFCGFFQAQKAFDGIEFACCFSVTAGSIAGGATMNPVILGVISGAGVILKTALEMKNLPQKIEQAKFAFTSYAKVLADLRSFMRGEVYHKEDFLMKLKTLDEIVIDLSLNWEKFLVKYKKTFVVE